MGRILPVTHPSRRAEDGAHLRACEAIGFSGFGVVDRYVSHPARVGGSKLLSYGDVDEAVALQDVVGESEHA